MKPRCVLQVEDDENDVFLLEYTFKQAQVPVPLVAVRDGKQAMEYLAGIGEFADRDRFPLPRLVLLDLKLPRKSGLEVLEWMRATPSLRELPVVVLTSSSRPEDIQAAYRFGANAYLVKPPRADQLLELVKGLSEFWLRYNQVPSNLG